MVFDCIAQSSAGSMINAMAYPAHSASDLSQQSDFSPYHQGMTRPGYIEHPSRSNLHKDTPSPRHPSHQVLIFIYGADNKTVKVPGEINQQGYKNKDLFNK